MTTYTVIDQQGELRAGPGLSLKEAAIEVLLSDGRHYELRPEDGGWRLWRRTGDRAQSWYTSAFWSAAPDQGEAEAEAWEHVVSSGPWPGHLQAITDEQWAAMLADADEM